MPHKRGSTNSLFSRSPIFNPSLSEPVDMWQNKVVLDVVVVVVHEKNSWTGLLPLSHNGLFLLLFPLDDNLWRQPIPCFIVRSVIPVLNSYRLHHDLQTTKTQFVLKRLYGFLHGMHDIIWIIISYQFFWIRPGARISKRSWSTIVLRTRYRLATNSFCHPNTTSHFWAWYSTVLVVVDAIIIIPPLIWIFATNDNLRLVCRHWC